MVAIGTRVIDGLFGSAPATPAGNGAPVRAELGDGSPLASTTGGSKGSRKKRSADRNAVKGARAESTPFGGLGTLGVPKGDPLNLTIPLLILIVLFGAVWAFRRWRYRRQMSAYY